VSMHIIIELSDSYLYTEQTGSPPTTQPYYVNAEFGILCCCDCTPAFIMELLCIS
jgi:hypothetical protein